MSINSKSSIQTNDDVPMREQIIDLLNQRLTQTQVAKKLNLQIGTVHAIARTVGIKRQSKINQEDHEKIVEMLDSGMTLQAVGDQFNVSRERIRQIAQKKGIESRSNVLNRLKVLVVDDFSLGLDDADIATKHNIDIGFVRRTRLGVGLRKNDVTAKTLSPAIERVRAGDSIRNVALSNNINPERLRVACKKAGIKSKYGRWQDYSHRFEIVDEMYSKHSWDQIAAKISGIEGKKVTGQALQSWVHGQPHGSFKNI